jgi:ABC-type sugar transport system permease subunit
MADADVALDRGWKGTVAAASPGRLTAQEHRCLARAYYARRALWAYAFLAPSLIFFTIFLLVPCVQLLWLTFHEGGIYAPPEFVGLTNWQETFDKPLVRTTIANSVRYALIAIPTMFVIGLGLAMLLLNVRRGGPALRAVIYFPTLAPLIVVGSIWLFVLHPDFGILNMTLQAVGVGAVNWLGDPTTALPTIALIEVWRGIGFWSLFFLAALYGLPRELYQAAHLDGANAWQRFRYLTLPLLRPTFLFAVVLAIIYNLQIFDTVFIMTDGGPINSTATVVWYIFRSIYVYEEPGFGATLSFVLLLLILALTLVALRLLRARRVG